MTYNSSIYTEQGASVMRFVSGASLVMAAGAKLDATLTPTALAPEIGASVTYTTSGADGTAFKITDGTRSAVFQIGRNVPTHSGSAGDLYIRSDGSMSNWYINRSSGTAGSVWRSASELA